MTARAIAARGLVLCLAGAAALAPAAARAAGSRGRVLIVNNVTGSLTVVDTSKKVVKGNPPLGNHPTKVLSDSQGRFAYVINTGSDSMSIVNVENLSVTTVPLGFQPSDLAITPNDTTVILLHADHDIASGGEAFKGDYSIYDVKKKEIERTNDLGGVGPGDPDPCGIVMDNGGDAFWITACADDQVVLIDLKKARENDSGDEVRAVLDTETGPNDIAITPR